ncbi:hypothetical protein [Calditerricola satsumensis]|uniref:hypothetical protein n=1 Tax=Calditerricola satsumensis TaxID=373054 RepID=UPI000B1C5786|nr:hypothetical protein [Calditerricola satsumensis]
MPTTIVFLLPPPACPASIAFVPQPAAVTTSAASAKPVIHLRSAFIWTLLVPKVLWHPYTRLRLAPFAGFPAKGPTQRHITTLNGKMPNYE